MKKLSQAAFILLCLSASLWFIRGDHHHTNTPTSKPSQTIPLENNTFSSISIATKDVTTVTQPKEKIQQLLTQQHFETAVTMFNSHYDELDDASIQQIQALFYQTAQMLLNQNNHRSTQQLIVAYLNSFQDSYAYLLLARTHVMQTQYQAAIDAAIRAYGLAFDTEQQTGLEHYIANLAANYATHTQDAVATSQTLTQLHNLFPENAQLTFTTAKMLNQIGDTTSAQYYLSKLNYAGNEYRQAAETLSQAIAARISTQTRKPDDRHLGEPQSPPNGITVPLKRMGSSYLVDIEINAVPLTLLLDTGASITALSKRSIDRLRLDKTQRKVRLSTANGTRTSHLYRTKTLTLGSQQLRQKLIVEIDLGQQARFDGLLGTDVLQQFNYQIDNRNHSLTLIPR